MITVLIYIDRTALFIICIYFFYYYYCYLFLVCVVHYMCLCCSIDLVSICANKEIYNTIEVGGISIKINRLEKNILKYINANFLSKYCQVSQIIRSCMEVSCNMYYSFTLIVNFLINIITVYIIA